MLCKTQPPTSAKGKRQVGQQQWTIGDRDKALLVLNDEQTAQTYYDEQIAKLEKNRFTLAGDDAPVVDPWREEIKKKAKRLNDALQQLDDKYGLVKTLESSKPVMLVGRRGAAQGTFWEISLEGSSVVTRTGSVGKKGRPSKEACDSQSAAIRMALLTIKTNLAMGYGVETEEHK